MERNGIEFDDMEYAYKCSFCNRIWGTNVTPSKVKDCVYCHKTFPFGLSPIEYHYLKDGEEVAVEEI
tara:strand:+ start:57 stop:257 length:201 start_codon:yes stop_codon:yes gene_type:complete